ncbi:hypothetical protein [Nitrosovibrio tenuis]|uniref:Uncharacterized protein n=1 Tax=Nitrosovibrio tenuis TaxID=1233 RepID=A0A1H7J0Z9_9PROT|nr:hypothetical protein [Nitrosovibrio tenuis]SEK67537.1 hypothetical protein SAMN05216387_102339 [Nitrosovibrio tenuis]
MTYGAQNKLVGYAALMVLILAFISVSAFAEQAPASDVPEQPSLPIGQPLTDFERMELHHRRYSAAANSMAQLFKQLNQKIQEVSLAAKTVAAKDNSQNRRQLDVKLRQLENASTTYGHQYSLLQSQMQNEYRNYIALSNELKGRYDTAKDLKSGEITAKDAGPKANPSKNKEPKVKEAKGAREPKEIKTKGEAKNIKAKDARTEDMQARLLSSPSAKDPRVINLDPNEVRARRDGTENPASAAASGSAPQVQR